MIVFGVNHDQEIAEKLKKACADRILRNLNEL
jgi:hypothetical protein